MKKTASQIADDVLLKIAIDTRFVTDPSTKWQLEQMNKLKELQKQLPFMQRPHPLLKGFLLGSALAVPAGIYARSKYESSKQK